ELLIDEPAEPLTRDLRALVRCRERARGRALSAVAAPASRAAHDASTLMLLDDVQLLLDDDIRGIERAAAAVRARVRPPVVRLSLEVRRDRLAPRRPTRLGRGLGLGRQRRSCWALVEGTLCVGGDDRWRRWRNWCGGRPLASTRRCEQ